MELFYILFYLIIIGVAILIFLWVYKKVRFLITTNKLEKEALESRKKFFAFLVKNRDTLYEPELLVKIDEIKKDLPEIHGAFSTSLNTMMIHLSIQLALSEIYLTKIKESEKGRQDLKEVCQDYLDKVFKRNKHKPLKEGGIMQSMFSDDVRAILKEFEFPSFQEEYEKNF